MKRNAFITEIGKLGCNRPFKRLRGRREDNRLLK
jgi:hypothetical protein